jgi:site-specific DNA-methyltransferase (adenine-specific)
MSVSEEQTVTTPSGACSRLINGDCLQALQTLPEASIDTVVTSPPYNLGINYKSYDDTMSRQDYLTWTVEWAVAVKRVLKDSGSLFLNLGSKPTDPWVPFEVVMALREHYCMQNVIHWIKSISIEQKDVGANYEGITQDITVGHYKPINSKRYLNDCHEYVFHLTKHGGIELERLAVGVPYQDKTNVARWKAGGQDLHCRGNTWFVPYKTIRSRELQRPHPASFPVELARKCIRLAGHTGPGARVLDPFLGIGHTGVAAVACDVSFVGIEIDPEYYAVACKEIADALEPRAAGARKSAKRAPEEPKRFTEPEDPQLNLF